MVFVKVRETYDLHTVRNKLTLIGIHTPTGKILAQNYPGLVMQYKHYRPVSADVAIACASLQPADPLQVSTAEGDIAPEDMFNPILYKAVSNEAMSAIESRLAYFNSVTSGLETNGSTAFSDNDTVTGLTDDFNAYYGLLSDTNGWRHAMPQSGLQMRNLKPLVFEKLYNLGALPLQAGSGRATDSQNDSGYVLGTGNTGSSLNAYAIRGNAKPMPALPTGVYPANTTTNSQVQPGFSGSTGSLDASAVTIPVNAQCIIPSMRVMCGCIIMPPSRLHELYYRMVVEWTVEFTDLCSYSDRMTMGGLADLGAGTHYIDYSYSAKDGSKMDNDASMVSASVDIEKVM